MENNTETNPMSREMALNALEMSAGWKLFCARQKEICRQEIDLKIFDSKTPAAEREKLVLAREVLVESYTPEKILQSMQVQAKGEVSRMVRDEEARKK